MNKDKLRLEMKAARRALTAEQIKRKSENIIESFANLEEYKNANILSIYMSAFKEPDTSVLINQSLKSGKRVAVPISHTDTRTITLAYFSDNTQIKQGAYGISEPQHIITSDKDDVDIIIVPGLAFDKKGNRLGFGMGYYDTLLAEMSALKVGFCYDFQLLDEIPVQEHDIPMDIVITETTVIT